MALTQVGTDGVKDDAVTLAKQAAGTDGQIITYDASGNPVAVGPGTDGQVLTSTGAGSPPAFEAIPTPVDATKTTLTGSTNNTITTVTGANAIQGEANLTCDGNNLTQTIDADGEGVVLDASGNHKAMITGNTNRSAENNTIFGVSGKWNDTEVGRIAFEAGADTTNKDDGHINFYTTPSGGSLTSRMRIASGGEILFTRGGITATPSLEIYGSGNTSNSVDAFRFHNWGNSDGDYWDIGVNHGLDANGNNDKLSDSKKGAGIRLNGKNGKVTLITSGASSTEVEGLTQNELGYITKAAQPYAKIHFNHGGAGGTDSSTLEKQTSVAASTIRNGMSHTTGRITVPIAGTYLIYNHNNNFESGSAHMSIKVNGSTINGGNAQHADTSEIWKSMSVMTILDLSASDYVESWLFGKQDNATWNSLIVTLLS